MGKSYPVNSFEIKEKPATRLIVESWWVCPVCDNKNVAEISDTPFDLQCPECESIVFVDATL